MHRSESTGKIVKGAQYWQRGLKVVAPALALMLGLAGCGFGLYGQGHLGTDLRAVDFSQVRLSSDGPSRQLLTDVKLAIAGRNQRIAKSAEEATYKLSLSRYENRRHVDNLTPAGIAIEYRLEVGVHFRLTAQKDGRIILEGDPGASATSTRIADNPVTNQQKEDSIEETLRAEVAQQILTRIEMKLAQEEAPGP